MFVYYYFLFFHDNHNSPSHDRVQKGVNTQTLNQSPRPLTHDGVKNWYKLWFIQIFKTMIEYKNESISKTLTNPQDRNVRRYFKSYRILFDFLIRG